MRYAFLLLAASAMAAPVTLAKAPDKPWLVHVRAIGVFADEQINIPGPFEIDDAFVPEVDVNYYFHEDWSVELIAASSPHDVWHAVTGDLGSAWVLPPTLTLKYHLPVDGGDWRPYVGVGVNYTTFWNIDNPPGLDMDYSDSWGIAYQAGVEVELGGNWTFNFDVKKIDIDTEVTIRNAGTGAVVAVADVEIDPVVVGIGFGYRF